MPSHRYIAVGRALRHIRLQNGEKCSRCHSDGKVYAVVGSWELSAGPDTTTDSQESLWTLTAASQVHNCGRAHPVEGGSSSTDKIADKNSYLCGHSPTTGPGMCCAVIQHTIQHSSVDNTGRHFLPDKKNLRKFMKISGDSLSLLKNWSIILYWAQLKHYSLLNRAMHISMYEYARPTV